LERVVYADVLVSINLFVSYFILLAVSRFLNIEVKRLNLILASLLGGVYSLTIFLPPMSMFFSLLIKLITPATMLLVVFGFRDIKFFLKAITTFHMINFIFLGATFLLWNFVSPPGLFMKNDVVYINISPIFLAISTFVSYIIFTLMNKVTGRKVPEKIFLKVAIGIGGKEIEIRAKIDTGNTLREPFSSLPVMVVEYGHIQNIIPGEIKSFIDNSSISSKYSEGTSVNSNTNCRIVPFKAISGEGILPAFKPDKFYLINSEKPIFKEVYIAVCKKGVLPREFEALVGEELAN
jgi:stage II sporulation protein GA (sporulation sigma-E factor processing peptidase)